MKRAFTPAFVLVLALLCVSELVVRVFFARNMSGRFEYGYHPTSGFEEQDDGSVHLVRAGGRRFHPQSFSRRRPDGVLRVMVVGDSVPRGSSLDSAYANQLAELLRQQGVPAEAINLAVPGYGAHRSQIVLRRALEYEPSFVILHVNNSNEYEDEREWKRSEEFKSWHPKNWLMKSLLLRRLYEAKTERLSWKWLPAEIRARTAVSDADAEVAASMNSAKLRVWDERVRRFTAESVALARERGVPLLLISQARRERSSNEPVRLDDHGLDALIQPLAGDNVSFLSLKELLNSRPFDDLFADSVHLRRDGHRILAEAVVTKMRQAGLAAGPGSQ